MKLARSKQVSAIAVRLSAVGIACIRISQNICLSSTICSRLRVPPSASRPANGAAASGARMQLAD